jgi:uncharacterized membrane protein YhaH (DUF805 family)
MDLKKLLFSSEGRIPRSTWWYFRLAVGGIGFVLTFGAVMIISLMANSLEGDSSALLVALFCIGIPLYLFVIFTDIMVSIKRCHDRNRSGWFLLWSYVPSVIYSIFSGLFVVPLSISYNGYDSSSVSNIALVLNCILSLVVSGLGLWVFIELGFMKGTTGPNQYGLDPTMPASMQGAQFAGQMGYAQPPAGQAWYEQQPADNQPAPIQPGVVPPEIQPLEPGALSGRVKTCPHCGEAIEIEAAYCKYCGRAQS